MNTSFDRPILIVGTGSVGKRHLKNLQELGHKNFVLCRTGKSTLPADEIKDIPVEYDLDKALSHKPVATIIANPTALHIPVALKAARADSHLFIEKPISHNLNSVEELKKLVRKKKLIVQVGFQFRFHPELIRVKKEISRGKIGKVISVEAHWGEYLPEWHPWEDYRKGYAARKDLGGGVLLTLCHPFDYLRFLFGEVVSVIAQEKNSGGLKIDVEDTADVLLKFASGVAGNVHLDYLQKPAEHYIRIIGQNGIIHLDFLKSQSERNKMFIEEMKNFLMCIKKNKQPKCGVEDGIKSLEIILAAKKSASNGKVIELKI